MSIPFYEIRMCKPFRFAGSSALSVMKGSSRSGVLYHRGTRAIWDWESDEPVGVVQDTGALVEPIDLEDLPAALEGSA